MEKPFSGRCRRVHRMNLKRSFTSALSASIPGAYIANYFLKGITFLVPRSNVLDKTNIPCLYHKKVLPAFRLFLSLFPPCLLVVFFLRAVPIILLAEGILVQLAFLINHAGLLFQPQSLFYSFLYNFFCIICCVTRFLNRIPVCFSWPRSSARSEYWTLKAYFL